MVEKTSDIVVAQINKRLDNVENRITKRLETVEEKMSCLDDKINSVNTILQSNTLILSEHMRRTEANERAIVEFRVAHTQSLVEFKSFQGKVLGGIAAAAFLIPILLNLLNKVM